MKVFKVVLMVLDFDEVGSEGIKDLIEGARYPNRAISPRVIDLEARDIGDWYDDHPLNQKGSREAFERLFASPKP